VASRHQLRDLGMKGHAMQYRARREGPWQTLPGVCLIVSGVPGGPQKEMAALLYGGSGSLITGPAALMHYSIRGGPAMDVIDVLVPATPQRHSAGICGHRAATTSPWPRPPAWRRREYGGGGSSAGWSASTNGLHDGPNPAMTLQVRDRDKVM